jgi:hypothetical protein
VGFGASLDRHGESLPHWDSIPGLSILLRVTALTSIFWLLYLSKQLYINMKTVVATNGVALVHVPCVWDTLCVSDDTSDLVRILVNPGVGIVGSL